MKGKQHYQIAVLLFLSAMLLASLIPGGPVENRDFSHIHTGILAAFNIFLTVLNLGSFALTYFVIKQRPWTHKAVFFAALCYFFVYAVDLAQLFPRSPTPMSQALAVIEVLGMCTAVPLIYLSLPVTASGLKHGNQNVQSINSDVAERAANSSNGVRVLVMAFVLALGIGIITFATDSARNSANDAEYIAQ